MHRIRHRKHRTSGTESIEKDEIMEAHVTRTPHVVIIGGGFGGLNACRALAGAKVRIRRNANLSTGGTATDVTDEVHPEIAACAVDAARAIGLDIAGVNRLGGTLPWHSVV